MANFAATALLEARSKITERANSKFEQRAVMGKLIDMFMYDREYTIPELDAIRKSSIQATKALYLTKYADTVGSAKSCAPTGKVGDSGAVALTWQTKSDSITISSKRHNNNEYSMLQAMINGLMNMEKNLLFNANGVDAAIAAFLDANRTQVNLALPTAGAYNTWDGVNFNMDVALADKERFYVDMLAEMAINNYEGVMLEAANVGWRGDAVHFSQQGAQNDENLAYQFSPEMNVNSYLSNNLTPGTGIGSVHYIVPAGGVAILDWNDPLNVGGQVSGDKEWTTYNSILKPGIVFDLFTKTECADTSASGGDTQDFVTTIEMSINYALTEQPFSAAGESAIYKYDIANA